MKNLKNLIAFSLMLISIYSCDTRLIETNEDTSYQETNSHFLINNPNFGANEEWNTSANDSVKNGNSYIISLKVANNKPGLKYSISQTNHGKIYRFGTEVVYDSLVTLTDTYMKFKFKVDSSYTDHTEQIIISLQDSLGNINNLNIDLLCFYNITPNIVLNITQEGIFSTLDYKLDLSSSVDGDAKFGGEIIEYSYSIEGDGNLPNNEPVINYVFPYTGSFLINVKCKDNNNEWSDIYTTNLIIQ